MSRPVDRRFIRVLLGGALAGSILTGSFLPAGERTVRNAEPRTAKSVPWLKPARKTAQENRVTSAAHSELSDPGENSAACPCPTQTGPMTMRPVPCTEPIGIPVCHRNFSGDCYGENWRLHAGNRNPCASKCSQRFHFFTREHAAGMERFLCGLCGKTPRGYVHDTSGFPLRSFFVPQPTDPSYPLDPPALTYVYDYPQYIVQPSGCRLEPGSDPVLLPTTAQGDTETELE